MKEMNEAGNGLIKFFDYFPKVFSDIRKINKITRKSYLKSLGLENLSKFSSKY